MKNIGIICGGPSSEYEVSLGTASSFLKNINREKYTPYIFHISKELQASMYKPKEGYLIEENKLNFNPFFEEIYKLKDMYANILALHGEFGEDGTIQSILDTFNIPYTGSGFASSALCMDKYRSSIIVEKKLGNKYLKIPKTKIVPLRDLSTFIDADNLPLCIKPNAKGSSVGVYILRYKKDKNIVIKSLEKEFTPNTEFVLQPALDFDIEISCGCLENKYSTITYLPPIEIIPNDSDFFDYKAKYTKGGSTEITPPVHISRNLSEKISKLAADIHNLLDCKLYSRSDFLIKGKDIYYLETNTLPGMTTTSLLPQEASAAGISFTELIDFLIENS